jgi:nicotinate-nucleotide pyrophosphorylase (carboxylating)
LPESRSGASRSSHSLATLVRLALEEDRARSDATTRRVLPRPTPAAGLVTVQEAGTLSGMRPAVAVARAMRLRATALARDGATLRPGAPVLRLEGDARGILAAERTILNFLMHLSGVATLTRRTVERARKGNPRFEVLATRKTTPGLRELEKEAVVHGGGRPHRSDLASAILVKNNHLSLAGLDGALGRLRESELRDAEVEVRSVGEARRVLQRGIRRLLLDNFRAPEARRAVRAIRQMPGGARAYLELSGGIRPERIREFARTGADAASLGALTHSAPALPFHLTVRRRPARARRPR